MSAVSVGAVHRLPTNGIADKPHCHRSVRAAGGQRRRDKSLSMGVLYIWIGRISQKGDEPITPAKRVQGATSPLQWLACIRCCIEAPASGCSALEQSILPFAVMGQHPEAVFLSALATTCVDLILPFASSFYPVVACDTSLTPPLPTRHDASLGRPRAAGPIVTAAGTRKRLNLCASQLTC